MAEITRREVLGTAGKVVLGGAAAALAASGPARAAEAVGKKQFGMLVDLGRCIGCQACTVACKAENGVPLGVFRRRVRTFMTGAYPNPKRHFTPISCFHCEKPKCLTKCPEKAISKSPDGLVLVDKKKCTNKKRCLFACPYKNIFISPEDNKADKCTFCVHRVRRGVAPACVQTCEGGALMFGEISDPNSEIAQAIKANGAKVLKPEAGTNPSLYYIGLEGEVEAGMRKNVKRRGQLKGRDLERDR